MHFLLGLLVVLFNVADNATTFLCLRTPVAGFDVSEANPFAAWLFQAIGLGRGLLLETLVTTAAVSLLVLTPRIPRRPKLVLLTVLAVLPAWAALNNYWVMQEVGIALGVGG